MQIDANRKGKLPPVAPASPFQSRDGRFRGWKVTLPGHNPLATPAVMAGQCGAQTRLITVCCLE